MYVGVKIKGREGAFYKTVSNNVTEVKLICEKISYHLLIIHMLEGTW